MDSWGKFNTHYNPFYNVENPMLMGYEYAWIQFIKHNRLESAIITDTVANSWRRCRDRNMNYSSVRPEKSWRMPENDAMSDFLVENGGSLLRDIFNNLESSSYYGIITDAAGKKLYGLQNASDESADRLRQLGDISDFSEEKIGTNGFSLAAEIERPCCMAGAQHYCEQFHKYVCYVSPIQDAANVMIGMVGICTLTENMDDCILSFAVAVGRAVENALKWHDSKETVEKQNEEKQLILNTVSDGVLYVDGSGTIVHGNDKLHDLFGFHSEQIVGMDVNRLNTVPAVEELRRYPFSTLHSNVDNKISIVNTRGESAQSFFNKYKIDYGPQRGNEIWVFTVCSNVKKLAHKLLSGNRSYYTFSDIKSGSAAMRTVLDLAKKASAYEVGTIIEGDSGTGKEMLAQAIHNYGPRKDNPFVAVDCGALPGELMESSLFGYVEGAFTGAKRGGSPGVFEIANKGVLFLDEITNLSYDTQAKLLRALQERQILPLGGTEPISFDVQVIAATNRDILKEIENGRFRRDLFYRLNVIHIKIPALCERENDLDDFFDYFIGKYAPKGDKHLSEEAKRILRAYEWPGNVRQLENVIERMVIMSDVREIGRSCIPEEILHSVLPAESGGPVIEENMSLSDVCSRYVERTIRRCGGNIKKAAGILGVSRVTVYKYLENGRRD